MIHYIYKITFLCGYPCGRYYLGKRSFHGNDLTKDRYAGSGNFCRDYYKQYGKRLGETYLKEIIEINPSAEINDDRENIVIGDKWKTDPLCMNLIGGGTANFGSDHKERVKKSVLQYDLSGNLIKEYESIAAAAGSVNALAANVSNSCRKRHKTCSGFLWRFSNDPLTKEELKTLNIRSIPIKQYTPDLKFIKEWSSIKEASETLKISAASIGAVCNHSSKRHTAGGFVWSFFNEEPQNNSISVYREAKKVAQCKKDGCIIKIYDSIREAARKMKCCAATIRNACNKDLMVYGYKWKFVK